jgi:hypothetical protein
MSSWNSGQLYLYLRDKSCGWAGKEVKESMIGKADRDWVLNFLCSRLIQIFKSDTFC